ncbi:MAG: hypothetical protein VW262_08685 [Flavobacteriaceae bacterium]
MPDEKMVDIDTSGPEAEVELKEEATAKEPEVEVETKDPATSSAPQEASSEKQETDTKKEELEDYSKDVQRRIAKLTKKWREAERQRDEAVQFAKLQKEQKESFEKRYTTLESTSIADKESKIKSLLDAQKAKLTQAREAGDTGMEVEISKEIARLGYEEARLQELKSTYQSQPQGEKKEEIPSFTRNVVPKDIPMDERAESWASKNRWFGTDKAMTYTAFDIHRTLIDEEGFDPKTEEYYAEIDKRIRLEFPHKFGNNDTNKIGESTKPTQIVAGAKRSVNPGRKTVRLTPSQVAIAKKLGVSLEDYAKQLKLMKEV